MLAARKELSEKKTKLPEILSGFVKMSIERATRDLSHFNFWYLKTVIVAFLWIAGIASFACLVLYLFVIMIPSVSGWTAPKAAYPGAIAANEYNVADDRLFHQARKELELLEARYNRLTPRQPYLVINTSDNHFYLYHNKSIIREGFVSTGSNIRMITNDNRKWVFKTPKGKHTVKNKITSPLWKKPDWAFIEDGLPVPPMDHPSRFEYGSLGDYALNLGDGYLIHGTLYKRLLGLSVTHGCIRLNDEDLEFIYKSLNPGSRVYIF